MHRLPLDARRKRRTATATQPRGLDLVDDRLRRERQRALETDHATVCAILTQRQRIDDAGTCERDPLLVPQPGDRLDESTARRMRDGWHDAAREQRCHLRRRDVREADATSLRVDLDQRFQPVCPARTVPHDARIKHPCTYQRIDGVGHIIGTDGTRAGVIRHEDACSHGAPRSAATSASNRAVSTVPCTRSPIRTEGPSAQLPKQYAASR